MVKSVNNDQNPDPISTKGDFLPPTSPQSFSVYSLIQKIVEVMEWVFSPSAKGREYPTVTSVKSEAFSKGSFSEGILTGKQINSMTREMTSSPQLIKALTKQHTPAAKALLEQVMFQKLGSRVVSESDGSDKELFLRPDLLFTISQNKQKESLYTVHLPKNSKIESFSIDKWDFIKKWSSSEGNLYEFQQSLFDHFNKSFWLVSIIRKIMNFLNGSNTTYVIRIKPGEIKNQPDAVLHRLNDLFTAHVRKKLKSIFEGVVGLDSGGLSRQLITDLCYEFAEKKGFKKFSNGSYRPVSNRTFLSKEEKRDLRELGTLMMFCLNSAQKFQLGKLFDLGVFEAILFFKEDSLEGEFEAIDFKDPKIFNEMFTLYEKMTQHQDTEILLFKRIQSYLEPLENLDERQLKDVAALACDFLSDEEIQRLGINPDDVESIKKNYPVIQEVIRENIVIPILLKALAPLFEIAKGMKGAPFHEVLSWQKISTMQPSSLSEALQGKTVTSDEVLKKLTFLNVEKNKQEWIKNWIQNADQDKLKIFLYEMTGSYSLGHEPLKIFNNFSEKISFHSCFSRVDIPLAIQSEEKLILHLDACMGKIGEYNIL